MESTLALYLKDIGRYSLLTKEQELELGRRIKEDHDEEARQTLINSNLRLVIKIAKDYRNGNHNIPLEDLIDEGNIGLMTAVEKYDYTRELRFSTCAVPWIKQAITKSILDNSRMIRIPAHIIQEFNNYKKACEALFVELERNPTDQEVADYMKVDVQEIKDLLVWKQNTFSLDTPIGEDEDGAVVDLCADPDESPADYTEKSLKHDFVLKLINGLDARTKQIFKLRFGIWEDGDPEEYSIEHTLEEIGAMLNPTITRERVRQIVAKQIAAWKVQYGDKLQL